MDARKCQTLAASPTKPGGLPWVARVVLGDSLSRLKSDQGHILVRVNLGGDTYRVIILDDSAESFKVKAIHGTYKSE